MQTTAPAARLAVLALAGAYLASVWLDGVGSDLPRQLLPRSLHYFAQVAQLFPQAATGSIDSRAEVWLCSEARWQEIDIGAYFPLDRDTKENRFHRTLHFYPHTREVMQALDWYVVAGHAAGEVDDGVAHDQSVGGVRFFARRVASTKTWHDRATLAAPAAGGVSERAREVPVLYPACSACRALWGASVIDRGREVTSLAIVSERLRRWALQPAARLELFRITTPLAILGFMSSRLVHADEWLGERGFRPPDLGSDWRQPLYLPALPDNLAWVVAGVLLCSGLAVSAGWHARRAALVFAACLAFVALSDRLSAFTVSKLSPPLMLALALSPCGTRFGIDARRARQQRPEQALPEELGGATRFIQLLVPTMYSASGIAKLRGDWLTNPLVLWTHLHDSYQTGFSWLLANALPPFGWTLLQAATLVLEVGAPLWFWWRKTRPLALVAGLVMHAFIGLCFGPVKWFALLMASLLAAGYLPAPTLGWLSSRLTGIEVWKWGRTTP